MPGTWGWAGMMQMQSSGRLLARVSHRASLCSMGFPSQYGEFLSPVQVFLMTVWKSHYLYDHLSIPSI